MRRGVVIAGHVVVVAAFVVGLYLLFFGGDQSGGPEISLNGGSKESHRGPRGIEKGPGHSPAKPGSPGSGSQSTAGIEASPGGIGTGDLGSDGPAAADPGEIGPPDDQYGGSVALLLMHLATAKP